MGIDWRPGMRITADRMRASTPQEWKTWTPFWDTTTGAALPSYGNARITGQYVVFGKMCVGRLELQFGTTTDFGASPSGSDNWQFSTPATAADVNLISGWGEVYDDSAGLGSRMGTRVRMNTVDTFGLELAAGRVDGAASGGVGLVDSVTPWTWANDDWVRFFFLYQTAE